MYNKYKCIIGLTGSVGAEAEKEYIKSAFGAAAFEVPQFLKTCEGVTKEEVQCREIFIEEDSEAQLVKVTKLVQEWYEKVPVLVITQGTLKDEMEKVYERLHSELKFEGATPFAAGRAADAEPTYTHCALTALHAAGHINEWVQQNHDG